VFTERGVGKEVFNTKEGVFEVDAGVHGHNVTSEEAHAREVQSGHFIDVSLEFERAGKIGGQFSDDGLELLIQPFT
jgi:hypothetical protein